MTRQHRLRTLAVVVVAFSLLAWTTEAAERWTVRTMAEILLGFHHAPSGAETAVLRQIVDDDATTSRERAVATAILNVRHVPEPEDKRLLEAMIVDRSTPSSLRTVATAIVNLTHTITDADRSALEALLE
jgi:hypothetical protein